MPNLLSHDLLLPVGLNSFFESGKSQGLTQAQNMDGFGRFRSAGKIPGSEKRSPAFGAGVDSVHHLEFLDLDGVRKLHQLGFSGGLCSKIDSASSLTSLTLPVDATVLTGERIPSEKMQEKMFFSHRDYLGKTGGMKYDGTRLTNWGVTAPGNDSTTALAVDSSTSWAASSAWVTLGTSTDGQWRGSGSMTMAINMVQIGYADRTGLGLNLSTPDFANTFVFLPYGVYQYLNPTGGVKVHLGDAGLTNSDVHSFDKGELVPGWNLLSLTLAAPDSTTGTGATLASIDTVRYEIELDSHTRVVSDVRWDDLFYYDDGFATATATGVTGEPSGLLSYRISYLTENGLESNLGPASVAVEADSEVVRLTGLPQPTDEQIIALRIYRDLDDDQLYRFVTEVPIGVVTYDDDVSLFSLGGDTAPIAGDDTLDNTPPPVFSAFSRYGEARMIGVDARTPSVLWISDTRAPEAWRIIDQLQLTEEIVAIREHVFGMFLYSTDRLLLLTGDGVNQPFRVDKVADNVGAESRDAVAQVKQVHITNRDEKVYIVATPTDPWFISGPIYNLMQDVPKSEQASTKWVHDESRFRVVGHYDSQTFVYQYGSVGAQQVSGEGSGVDPLDLRLGTWWTLDMPFTINDLVMVETDDDRPELWAACEDGYVRALQPASSPANWDDGTAVAVDVVSDILPMGPKRSSRGTPSSLLLEVTTESGCYLQVDFRTHNAANGDPVETVTKDVTIPPGGGRTVMTVPDGLSWKPWATVRILSSELGQDFIIDHAELFYTTRMVHEGPSE